MDQSFPVQKTVIVITKIFKSHLSKPSNKIVSRSTLGVNQISVAIFSRKNCSGSLQTGFSVVRHAVKNQ